MICQTFAQAEIIGKAAYAMDENGPVTNSELQHRYVQHVHPAGAIVKREVIAERGWPAANSDGRATMERWNSEGLRCYSADADDFRPAALAVAEAPTS